MASGVLIYLGAAAAEAAFRKVLTAIALMAGLGSSVAGVLIALASIGVMALVAIFVIKRISHRKINCEGTYRYAHVTKCSFLICVLMWFTLLPLGGMTSFLFMVQHVSPSELGKVNIGSYFVELALSIVLPLAIAGWMLMGTNKGVGDSPSQS